jgi:hypothetical protein
MSDRAAVDFPHKTRCQETGVIPHDLRSCRARWKSIGKAILEKSNAGTLPRFDRETLEASKDATTFISEKISVDLRLDRKN